MKIKNRCKLQAKAKIGNTFQDDYDPSSHREEILWT